jgi:hypothetical protein
MQKHIFILYMKDFIQYKLRILLEVVTDRDSNLNIPEIIRYGNSYIYTLEKFKNMIKVAQALAKNIPEEQLSVDYGNGGYEYMLSQTMEGDFIFRGKQTTKYFEPGSYKESQGGKTLYLYTKACSEYSDNEVKCKITYNPSVDAKIKILNDEVLTGVIERFIGDSLGYLDDKGEEIRKAKMTPDQLAKSDDKVELYRKKSTNPKGYFGNEQEIRNELSDLVRQRRELTRDEEGYETKLKTFKNTERDLRTKLANIESERRNRLSKNL